MTLVTCHVYLWVCVHIYAHTFLLSLSPSLSLTCSHTQKTFLKRSLKRIKIVCRYGVISDYYLVIFVFSFCTVKLYFVTRKINVF